MDGMAYVRKWLEIVHLDISPFAEMRIFWLSQLQLPLSFSWPGTTTATAVATAATTTTHEENKS